MFESCCIEILKIKGFYWTGDILSTALALEYGQEGTCGIRIFADLTGLFSVTQKLKQIDSCTTFSSRAFSCSWCSCATGRFSAHFVGIDAGTGISVCCVRHQSCQVPSGIFTICFFTIHMHILNINPYSWLRSDRDMEPQELEDTRVSD